jgi:hypothetical protein
VTLACLFFQNPHWGVSPRELIQDLFRVCHDLT